MAEENGMSAASDSKRPPANEAYLKEGDEGYNSVSGQARDLSVALADCPEYG